MAWSKQARDAAIAARRAKAKGAANKSAAVARYRAGLPTAAHAAGAAAHKKRVKGILGPREDQPGGWGTAATAAMNKRGRGKSAAKAKKPSVPKSEGAQYFPGTKTRRPKPVREVTPSGKVYNVYHGKKSPMNPGQRGLR